MRRRNQIDKIYRWNHYIKKNSVPEKNLNSLIATYSSMLKYPQLQTNAVYITRKSTRDLQYYVRLLKITCNIANLLMTNRNFIYVSNSLEEDH